MSRASAPAYDFSSRPLVVARVPSLPIRAATEVLSAPDPLEATREFYRNDGFARTALAVASPSLARAVAEWIDGKANRNSKTPLRALCYLLRMATRPTPFGLFAGVDAVEPGERTTLQLDQNAAVRRSHTRPDMGLMCKLADAFEKSDARERLGYVTNECAFVRGGRLWVTNIALTTYNTDAPVARTEQREVSLKHTDAVAFVRELCRRRETYGRIVAALGERFEAPADAAGRLLDRLIEAGVVISELRASPLGDPVEYLLERFDTLNAPFAPGLRTAMDAAAVLDATPLEERSVDAYLDLQNSFESLLDESPGAAIQTDLRRALTGTLGRTVLDDAALVADSYVRMGRVMLLEAFRSRFLDRYEGQERMVPLLELVDNNVGLGIVDQTSFEEKDDTERDAFIMRLACDAMRSNAEEIVLEGDLVDRFLPHLDPDDPVPSSLEIGFQIAAGSAQDVEAGNYLVVAGFTSDVAAKSLGRFAHVLGDEFETRVRDLVRSAVPEGELVAEFAYAPPFVRSYNVSIRPLLFEHEIRAGIGAPPGGSAISPDDLWVGIQNNRFFLWSKSLERRVTVRETHALMTYTSAPNLCRLLALLHADGKRFPGINWGAAAELTYLPRLRRGRVVLAPRRWRFARAAFGKTEADAALELANVRALWKLPRYVYLCDEDNRLLLDLDSAVTPALFADQAPETFVRIEEALPAPEGTWLPGRDGAHVAEFIAQAVKVKSEVRGAKPAAAPVLVTERTVYGPGSQWVYAKFYLGGQAIDDFIVSSLAPFVDDLRSCDAIDRWFFLRYGDPQRHVRIRLHATGPGEAATLRERLSNVAEGWLRAAKVFKYTLDTYDPEYERYGGAERLVDAERFFTYDSDLCVAVIADGIDDSGARIEAAAATVDALLRADEELSKLALEAYDFVARKKLSERDREALRRIAATPFAPADVSLLHAALEGPLRRKRLIDLVHMHCNRLGVEPDAEERVGLLLRSLALGRFARERRPEPAPV
jgi:hypothetical protein